MQSLIKTQLLLEAFLASLGVATHNSKAWKDWVKQAAFLWKMHSDRDLGPELLRTFSIKTNSLNLAWDETGNQCRQARTEDLVYLEQLVYLSKVES